MPDLIGHPDFKKDLDSRLRGSDEYWIDLDSRMRGSDEFRSFVSLGTLCKELK